MNSLMSRFLMQGSLLALCSAPTLGADRGGGARVSAQEWLMRVTDTGEPLWLSFPMLKAARAPHRRRVDVLTIRLPDKNGGGQAGWYLGEQEFDCLRGSWRQLSLRLYSREGAPIGRSSKKERTFASVLPHSPAVIVLKAACAASMPSGERFVGPPAEVYAHQADMRKNALGY